MDHVKNSNSDNGSRERNAEFEEQDEPSTHKQHVEDELAHFRAKWQQELHSHPKGEETQKRTCDSEAKTSDSANCNEDCENNARVLFLKGIEMEKTGKLYEAIQFYRKAVQIVPDIEFKLDYWPKLSSNERSPENSKDTQEMDDSSDDSDDNEIIEEGQLYSRIQKKVSKAGLLCCTKFEQNATHISTLPLEILLYILRWLVSSDLDLRSLEIVGSVSRGFYLCARDPEIWRLTCLRIWGLNCGTPGPYGSWRNMFIERPRLNYNGCYISKTTYIRHGENSFQDQFYRPWHLVAYYRYLRFFPEGIVLMLTSPEEPAQSVSYMKSRSPRPPVTIGYYLLKEDKVTLVVQKRQDVTKTIQSFKKGTRKREVIEDSEQTFHMELEIKNHKTRRHAKLVWTYYSVFTRTKKGDESTCTFDLKANRFPPLWFSRVKSFTAESDQPLT